ncbi:uncharacterized protein LOC104583996 [Brachypodium distachyon]|uniref:Uncharacterized protein n=1 Tax=Brachypodium distachyon TaxID=15368 RepID=A0A0Q3HM84_BRADI|nr:uncharacterized protein LOC104583996 [Brachypodium distachyon]KQJ94506.1 hypothetical protein BRADI_3g10930v3 [Brachypodium distachyon]|eukprot:XP_014756201.1 uncharacterized protein LOC104583996 [Brachypodium distachyon]
MGLCASMLQRKPKKRYPEPRRGISKALFVVRGDRRPAKPEQAPVFRAQEDSSGRSQLQKTGIRSTAHESVWHQGSTGALDKRFCGQLMPRLPCGCTRSTAAVEPDVPTPMLPKTPAPANRGTMPDRTPMTPSSTPMTPMRPVWQRRILMGMRCELPRFSGLILYDEHGRPLHIGTPARRNQGKKKTTRTSATTTLRELL